MVGASISRECDERGREISCRQAVDEGLDEVFDEVAARGRPGLWKPEISYMNTKMGSCDPRSRRNTETRCPSSDRRAHSHGSCSRRHWRLFIQDRELQSLQVAGISKQWHAAKWRTREGVRRLTSTTKTTLPGPPLQVSFTYFQLIFYY